MNNETSIKYISSLLNDPGKLTDGDQGSIALFRQTFPYFLPARYLIALELHRKVNFAPEMLSGMQPYIGDWMLFCDFMEAGVHQTKYMPPPVATPAPTFETQTDRVVDKKKVTAHPEPLVAPVAEQPPLESPVQVPAPVAEAPIEEQAPVPAPVAEAPIEEVKEEQIEAPVAPAANEVPVFEPMQATEAAPVFEEQNEPEYIVPPVAYEARVPELVTPVVPATASDASFADIIAAAIAADELKSTDVPAVPEEKTIPQAIDEPEVVVPEVAIPEAVASNTEPVVTEVEPEPEVIEPVYSFRQSPPVYAEPIMSHASQDEHTEDVIIPPVYETTHTSSPSMFIADIKETLSSVPAHKQAKEQQIEEAIPETQPEPQPEQVSDLADSSLIFPIYTGDYFLQQGEKIPEEIPQVDELKVETIEDDEDKSLMVVMSFSEWLLHFKSSSEKQIEETKDKRALRSMWQKEKLAAAIEEENEEIPENVFEMAVNSISKEEGLVSDTLPEIYIKQGKYDKAIEMYRKLSLRNPQKSIYFARKIEEALKDKES